ncbi:MAG: hypothetical protein Q8L81_07270 [Bacteroidota bacterium]|nr:hypothetical protein [Bacteroidota bacterium]
MKYILIIILVPFLGLAQKNKLDIDNGFKTYLFGTSSSSYKNLTLEIEEGLTKLYSLNEAIINFDGVEFEYVRLTFFKNSLSAISLKTKNSNGQLFLTQLMEKYGSPDKKSPNKPGNFQWISKKVKLLFANESGKDAIVDFYFNTK